MKDDLMSFNKFFSTSKDHDITFAFGTINQTDLYFQEILFEIIWSYEEKDSHWYWLSNGNLLK
jgi:hypothetical protein